MSTTKIRTGKVRLSYCNLFNPKVFDNGPPKYSVTLLIPKEDKTTINLINAAMEAAKASWTQKNGKKLPSNLKHTLHDGDGDRPNGGEFGVECKGHYVITVSTKDKPRLVNREKQDITDSTVIYSGCYAYAVINFYVFDNNGNKGVSAGLNGIMKLYDGEPLSGAVITDKDWGDFEDEDDDIFG